MVGKEGCGLASLLPIARAEITQVFLRLSSVLGIPHRQVIRDVFSNVP